MKLSSSKTLLTLITIGTQCLLPSTATATVCIQQMSRTSGTRGMLAQREILQVSTLEDIPRKRLLVKVFDKSIAPTPTFNFHSQTSIVISNSERYREKLHACMVGHVCNLVLIKIHKLRKRDQDFLLSSPYTRFILIMFICIDFTDIKVLLYK